MNGIKVNIALFSTLLLWASAFVGIRFGLVGYTPGALALLRFLVGSFSMLLLRFWLADERKIPWNMRLRLMLVGVAGIGMYNLCLNVGEQTVSAGVASFVIGLIPVFTILLSFLFLGERLGKYVWSGVFISMLGLTVLLFGETGHMSINLGVLIILNSAFMGGIYNVSQRFFLQQYHPVAATSWVIWGGTLSLMYFLPDLLREFPIADTKSTYAAIYMGIFPAAIAYAAWAYVLSNLSASTASIYLYGLPILSTILGFFLLGEIPSFMSLMGGLIALVGALIASQARSLQAKRRVLDNLRSNEVLSS